MITRSSAYPQYERPGTIFIDYPRLPSGRSLPGRFLRKAVAEQRIAGSAHPRHGPYYERVAVAIREAGASNVPLVLSNDMELAVFLRDRFPRRRCPCAQKTTPPRRITASSSHTG